MPVTVVGGGQFGSEGKGKVAHYLAKTMQAEYAVRCGGSNSGHTVIDEHGNTRVFRHLPTAAVLPYVKLALCAGSYIDVDVLLQEIADARIDEKRLIIDEEAVIITPECKASEKISGLISAIGSTGSGTGAAVAARIQRAGVIFAKDIPALRPYLADVAEILREALNRNARIILEGTQGFGLSPLHSKLFPKVTSRDTTAGAFVAEAGLSPFDVDDIALVIRAFPIRVAGDSGPLKNELSWDDITTEGNHPVPIYEYTTVTKKLRRVGRFDPEIVKRAISINQPTKIFLNHVDYLGNAVCQSKNSLLKFAKTIEKQICHEIVYCGTSPKNIIMLADA